MAIPTRSAQPGTFFVTTATYQRKRLFQDAAKAFIVMETLQHYRAERACKLYAFVLMPDHIHLILTPQGISLERVMGLIKGGSSHRLASKHPVWQKGFTDHRLRDRVDFDQHLSYVHENPVRAHMVLAPEEYRFSSAYRPAKQEHLRG